MAYLGVNIDHVATVRQARRTYEPDPVLAAGQALLGGAKVITIHLREDRRHIIDRDVRILRETVPSGLNLEMACEAEIVDIACRTIPDQATLVPEKREEVTTEGGLDVIGEEARVRSAVERLHGVGIPVSLFIDPDLPQIEKSAELGVAAIELHTGTYALAKGDEQQRELQRLIEAGRLAVELGLKLHAGHGLNYLNVQPVAAIANMRELNIGHSIIARAIFTGLREAVAEMKQLVDQASTYPALQSP
ncbi:pyridoxine 5'-phosphate synthase [Aureliella helgolandensis]|uniref:Pyridoxine 5'-phosphate synthase n=1 Tax=Aureliella helgolandensis TaxID=2527968 RepID=A0A518GEN4_9BACT|nr:pyridoxine 5'-phosphate synthase [Aureliella helgolandensis]QDV27020.1 Pyridoxine 5'-phosphate synthase [Aureliella helgolandensis]